MANNMDYLSSLGAIRQRNTQAIKDQLLSEVDVRTDILLSLVDPNPFQPRKDFGSVAEMARSLRKDGQYYPILVRKVGERYQVADGETRLRAATLNAEKHKGLDTIGAVIKVYTDEQMAFIAYRTAYERKNLNPLEEARGLKRLQEELHLTYAQLAEQLNKPEHYFTERMRLLRLPEDLLGHIEANELSPSQAINLATIKDVDQRVALTTEAIDKVLTVTAIREHKKAMEVEAKAKSAEDSPELIAKRQWKAFKVSWDQLTQVEREQFVERAARLVSKRTRV